MNIGRTLFDTSSYSSHLRISAQLGQVANQFGTLLDAHAGLDLEVRARLGERALRVKFRSACCFAHAASRLQHRQAAWDLARAALGRDIGERFCAHSPAMVEQAWREAGLPPRGQPITVRDIVQLGHLADYLDGFIHPMRCQGTAEDYRGVTQRFNVALLAYRRMERETAGESRREPPEVRAEKAMACIDAACRLLAERPALSAQEAVDQALASQRARATATPATTAPTATTATTEAHHGDAPSAADFATTWVAAGTVAGAGAESDDDSARG